jgi:hypothetical protein
MVQTKLTLKIPILLALMSAAPGLVLAEGQITGRVINGTTNQPAAGQEVDLLMPRGGMQQVGSVRTDAQGQFTISGPQIDQGSFYLLQTTYAGMDYHAPVQFDPTGNASAEIMVYEGGAPLSSLRLKSERAIVKVEGPAAHVEQMFAVENDSNPPRTYVNSTSTFKFEINPPAAEPTVEVMGMLNMPLPQSVTAGKKPGDYSIDYGMKPGTTVVAVVYQADYTGNKFRLLARVPLPADRAELLISPPSLQVDAPHFQSAGEDQQTGAAFYLSDNLKAGQAVEATISGEAAAEAQAGGDNSSGQERQVKTEANSMTRLGIPLGGCFLLLLLWALGVRTAKEWDTKTPAKVNSHNKELEAKAEELFNSLADLDELFAAGKIKDKKYWKDRLELKARLVATLRKGTPSLLESYANRNVAR